MRETFSLYSFTDETSWGKTEKEENVGDVFWREGGAVKCACFECFLIVPSRISGTDMKIRGIHCWN
jgi:hypothetical protein